MAYRLPTRASLDVSEWRLGGGAMSIPNDDTIFWAVLMRGREVQLLHAAPYVEAVCLAPHPVHGYLVFPMSVLAASALERAHPEFGTEGIMGQWKLERKAGVAMLALQLVRELPLDEFLRVVQVDAAVNPNPSWLQPCYDVLRGVTADALAAGALTADARLPA